MQWSEENDKWATDKYATDPTATPEAVEKRMKLMKEILKRPDPSKVEMRKPESDAPKKKATKKKEKPKIPGRLRVEPDETHRMMPSSSSIPLQDLKEFMLENWKEDEEKNFYERLDKYMEEKGEDITEAEIYEIWADEFDRMMKEEDDEEKEEDRGWR